MSRRITVLVVGFVLMLSACGGSGSPSASFDGEECTYAGPESVQADEIEVTFENSSEELAALAFLSLDDESARDEETASIGGGPVSVGGANPEGATSLAGVLEADPGQEATQTAPLPAGTYLLDCVTFSPAGPDEVWRVAVLEVEA